MSFIQHLVFGFSGAVLEHSSIFVSLVHCRSRTLLYTEFSTVFTVCWRRCIQQENGTRRSSAGAVIPPSHGPRPKRRLAACAEMSTMEASLPSQVLCSCLSYSRLCSRFRNRFRSRLCSRQQPCSKRVMMPMVVRVVV